MKTKTQQGFPRLGGENRRGVHRFAKGFTNHEQTDQSGLIYMQARYYLPMYHRFGSTDPALDQHFEETQSWNIYSYVQNNPIMHFDPDGQEIRVADPSLKKNVDRAIQYLKKDPVMKKEIEAVETSKTVINIKGTNNGIDYYTQKTIVWDPTSARANADDNNQLTGETVSPALRLGHELSHAAEDLRPGGDLQGKPDPKYGDTEEKRVITGPERSASKTLGEGKRSNHKGEAYKVKGPLSRKPTDPAMGKKIEDAKLKKETPKPKKDE